jgi:hypothetical protein
MSEAVKRAMVIGLLLVLLASCSRHESSQLATPTPTPSPNPLETALDQEIDAEDTVELRLTMRKAVTDYLKRTHPDWQVQGLSLSHFDGDTSYYIGADITSGSTSKVVQLRGWFLLKESGDTYWRIVELEGQ